MKKRLIEVLAVFFLIPAGCHTGNPTPAQYKYRGNIRTAQYQRNRAQLMDRIEEEIKAKGGPFYAEENDSLTKIIIDTILYGPNSDRFATFVITENADDKLLAGGSKNENHYNAYAFIGKLNHDSTIQNLSWVSAYNFVKYKTPLEASYLVREAYFERMTVGIGPDEKSPMKYNFDDVRFWNGPIWEKYYK